MQRSKVIKVRFEKARAKNKPKPIKAAKQGKPGLKPGKIFLYALGVAALGGGAFLVYDRLRKNPTTNLLTSKSDPETIIINNNLPASIVSSASSILRKDNFPLKRGSRGARVTQLQQALASIIGINAMNANGGIDGIFGPGTANALKMAGYSETIDQATFNKIIGSNTLPTGLNALEVANTLYVAAQRSDLSVVIFNLQQIKSVPDYTAVNNYYKTKGFISKTIVTDLLDNAFSSNESAKQEIRNEFLRMGLKVDSQGRWSLSGFGYRDLITIRETLVTDNQNIKIPVHMNTILGDEVKVANGYTWFRSLDNSVLQVPTQDVKYTN